MNRCERIAGGELMPGTIAEAQRRLPWSKGKLPSKPQNE